MTKVELSLHAIGLKNVASGLGRKVDPYAVVTRMSTQSDERPVVLGKTECIENTTSPEWCHVFGLDYEFGEKMKLVVSLFHGNNGKKHNHKSMGSCVFDVGEILGARGQTKAKRLKQGGGTLYANCRKAQGAGLLRLQLQGSNLKNTEGFLRKSDPFFEVARQINSAGASTWDNVYRSSVVQDNLNPTWDSAVLELSTLCGGDLDLPLRLSVFDFERSGKHQLMGQLETSVRGLTQAAGGSMPLTVREKSTGQVVIARAVVSGLETSSTANGEDQVEAKMATLAVKEEEPAAASKPGFLDYVAGGCELNVVVAIDFTGSNGDPRKPGTLHHLDSNSMNDYEKAISSIVEILSKYDSDQKFPVLGFGAKYDGVVQHAFQVGPEEESHGVQGVLKAYEFVFKSGLIMSSPTKFTEVMQVAAARAQSSLQAAQKKGGLAYTVLLIISDGAVSDVEETAECLKQISDSPLSVVIVGVGDADFSGMEFLDDMPDIKRDLAQFVQLNKHPHSKDLTLVTLREIPDQLTGYFASHDIPPGKPTQAKEADIVVEDEEEEIDLSLGFEEEEIVVSGGGFDTRGSW